MSVETIKSAKSAHYRASRAIRTFGRENGHSGLVSLAAFAPIRAKALPAVEAYAEWLAAEQSGKPNGRRDHVMTPEKLRRIAVMRHGGQSKSDAAKAVGFSKAIVGGWLARLPVELGGEAA